MRPKVSIAIITYNQEKVIAETLESVIRQGYESMEIVVSDDASTDNTFTVLRSYQDDLGRRLKLLRNESNIGITQNSNKALSACSGKYISWMGGDDVMLPGKIETQAAFMESNPYCTISYHDLEVFESATGNTLRRYNKGLLAMFPHQGGARELVRHGTFLGACSVMSLRNAAPPGGFDPRIPIASDWLFWIETAMGGDVRFIPQVLGRYRRHDQNITRLCLDLSEQFRTLEIVDEKYPAFAKHTRFGRSRLLYVQAMQSILAGRRAEGRRHLMEATRRQRLDRSWWRWYGGRALCWFALSFLPVRWQRIL